jgi:hypothetical protein
LLYIDNIVFCDIIIFETVNPNRNTNMKKLITVIKVGLWFTLAITLLGVGASIESQYHFFGPQYSGLPKNELPPVGSTVYVDWSEGDVFVGRHAGKRSYFKTPPRRNGPPIILEAGKAYEVVEKEGHLIALWPIR